MEAVYDGPQRAPSPKRQGIFVDFKARRFTVSRRMAEGSSAYQIRDRLARGGMADIYLAQNRNSDYVVIRRLREDLAKRWATVRQFNAGNAILSQLNHPNIVRHIESGKSNGLPYVVLEYVDGPNLREMLLSNYAAIKQQTMRLLQGMAAALNHVHERGFLHLDFKPENVLVPRDFTVKLIDFDLCVRQEKKFVKLKKLAGTPAYLAPEVLQQRVADERADIFSFGVTAYEVCTQRKPFAGATVQDLLAAYADPLESVRPPREFNKEIPIKLERIILKCLAKNVEQRYPFMSLVLRDFQGLE